MNITCSQCTRQFSISAEQLGTRGKCPHCRATVILPKAKTALGLTGQQLEPPSRWTESTLCGMGAVILHLMLLILLALVPWGNFMDDTLGEGDQLLIGQLPQQMLVNEPDDEFEPIELESPNNDTSTDEFESEILSPDTSDIATDRKFDFQAYSANQGGRNPMEVRSTSQTSMVAGGSQDFGNLLSKLQRDGLDIVITFDSTGSMQGEIDQVKDKIERIGKVLFDLVPKTRLSICTYRDQGDDYIVKGRPLTDNLAKVVLFLNDINASGGGDEPEAVERGLQWSIINNDFRRRARKVILLFGDAPPRPRKQVQCEKLASEFRKMGGVVNTVTCRSQSGPMPEFVSIARIGRGEAFLTRNEREIMTQLIVLVFGSQHRDKVLEAFDLLKNQ